MNGEPFGGFIERGEPSRGATEVSRPAREPFGVWVRDVCASACSTASSSSHRWGAGLGLAGGDGVLMPSFDLLPVKTEADEMIGVMIHFFPADRPSPSIMLVLLDLSFGLDSGCCL